MLGTKYPDIEVKLNKQGETVFSILGKMRVAMQNRNVPDEVIKEFMMEATSGDFDGLLVTCMKYVRIV